MNVQLSPKQSFVLWSLLISGDEPMMSKVKPKLSPTERKTLLEAGLISLEKRGQATHIVLADKAWAWASENYEVEFPSRTTAAVPILQSLIQVMGKGLQAHQLSLAEFLVPQESPEEAFEEPDEEVNNTQNAIASLENKIREAYAQIYQGGVGVRLSDLRQGLGAFPRQEVDDMLRQMQLERRLVLMGMDDPQAIAPEDKAAAIDIGGESCHIVYLKD